jgi:hypothetical protein
MGVAPDRVPVQEASLMQSFKLLPSLAAALLLTAAPLSAEAQSLEEGSSVSAMLKVAADLRVASESLEQSMQKAEQLSQPMLDTLERISGNVADIGRGFDPLGMKETVRTIQAQQQIIQQQQQQLLRAQRREIRRLRAELRPHLEHESQSQPLPRRQRRR